MTTITLYWSNICILHRLEQQMLKDASATLATRGIDLRVRHFGIGHPQRMAEYLAQPDAEFPDLIVSTDLEVFEDFRIFGRFREELHPLANLLPLRREMEGSPICQWPELLLFLAIPLVVCAAGDFPAPEEGLSLADVIRESGVAFGGTKNSAARAVIKTLWDLFGEETACDFARRSDIQPMPINAFRQVRTGGARLALVPSLYAKSADEISMKRLWPKEGAIGLPSYVAARKSLPPEVVNAALDVLLSPENCATYEQDGDLYCPLQRGNGAHRVSEHKSRLLYPSRRWFQEVSPEHFEQVYTGLVGR